MEHNFVDQARGAYPVCTKCGYLIGDAAMPCMDIFAPQMPRAPDWKLDWDWFQQFDWVRALEACQQDPNFHAEGNVWIHTKMVLEALVAQEEWRSLPIEERSTVFTAALLHDVSKPETTRVEEDGHIGAPHHSPKGALRSRGILYALRTPLAAREQVAALIRNHQQPFHLFKKLDPARAVAKMSLTTNLQHLYLLSTADNEGRVSVGQADTRGNVDLFKQQAEELGCYGTTFRFAAGGKGETHTRFRFNRSADVPLQAQLFDDTVVRVVLMAGLPGSGKSTYIQKHFSGVPVISLDEIRLNEKIASVGDQGVVVRLAKEKAKEYLRARQPFVLDATNIVRRHRDDWIDLMAAYNASVEIIYLDVEKDHLLKQNLNRPTAVPERVIENMIAKWEVPDLSEAHIVRWIEEGKEVTWPKL